jgi:hypothetical protein
MNKTQAIKLVRERQAIHGGLASNWDMAEEWVAKAFDNLNPGGFMSMGMPDGGRLEVQKDS